MKCPECNGKGIVGADGPVVYQSGIPFEQSAEHDCDECDGTGEVAAEYDGPMYSGEGLGDAREYVAYREAMHDAGRRW